jgi:cell division protein ZapA
VTITRVEIFGQSLPVQGELQQDYVAELARYVDARMHALAATAGTADPGRLALLAALNIADELFTLRSRWAECRERVARCLDMVEAALRRTGDLR